MSVWLVMCLAILGMISFGLFVGLILTLSFRIYWIEKEAHARRMSEITCSALSKVVRKTNGPA